jgi:hypothetical protein
VKLNDVDDELTIPLDLFEEAPPPAAEKASDDTLAAGGPNAGKGAGVDASAPSDASVQEAGITDAKPPPREAGPRPLPREAGAPRDAGTEDGAALQARSITGGDGGADGGAVASSGPRDPGAMIGMAGLVAAGEVNVTLLVNMQVIRANPTGAKLGPLLMGIPQWKDFMKGNETQFDPVQSTDWILIYGPSLIHTERDAVILRYNSSDEIVDNALAAIAKANGDPEEFDAGVPGVTVTIGKADNAKRAYLRAQSHVLVIVPPDSAATFAKVLKKRGVNPKVRPGEAVRLVVKKPWRQVSIPGLQFPKELAEIRLWVVPAADGSAEVFGEGDCGTEEAAVTTAETMTQVLTKTNSGIVAMATGGLLNGVNVEPEGTGVKLHVTATPAQLGKILSAIKFAAGVE